MRVGFLGDIDITFDQFSAATDAALAKFNVTKVIAQGTLARPLIWAAKRGYSTKILPVYPPPSENKVCENVDILICFTDSANSVDYRIATYLAYHGKHVLVFVSPRASL